MSVIGPYVKFTCEQPSCSVVVDDFDYRAFEAGNIPRGWTRVPASRRFRCPKCSEAARTDRLKFIASDLIYDIDNGEPMGLITEHVERTISHLTVWLEGK